MLQAVDTVAVNSQAPCEDSADIADLFDKCPDHAKAIPPDRRGSFTFCIPDITNDENSQPNTGLLMQPHNSLLSSQASPKNSQGSTLHSPALMAGHQEQQAAVQQATQKEPMQNITPRRRRGGWGSALPLQDQEVAMSTHAANHIAADSLHRGEQPSQVVSMKRNVQILGSVNGIMCTCSLSMI